MSGTTILRRRRDVYSLGPQLNDFRNAMAAFQAIRDHRGYDFISGFHGYPGAWCWHSAGGVDNSAQFPGQYYAFLPWHRAYLKWFEDHLLDHNPNISLPYWDWTSVTSHQEGIPNAYRSTPGGANPLLNFNSPSLVRFHEERPDRPGVSTVELRGEIQIRRMTYHYLPMWRRYMLFPTTVNLLADYR